VHQGGFPFRAWLIYVRSVRDEEPECVCHKTAVVRPGRLDNEDERRFAEPFSDRVEIRTFHEKHQEFRLIRSFDRFDNPSRLVSSLVFAATPKDKRHDECGCDCCAEPSQQHKAAPVLTLDINALPQLAQ
jgi:hypothetical protein